MIIFSCTPPEGLQDCFTKKSPEQPDVEAEDRNEDETDDDERNDDETDEDGGDEDRETEQGRGE